MPEARIKKPMLADTVSPLRSLGRSAKNWLQSRQYDCLDLRWRLRSGVIVRIGSNSDWAVFSDIFLDGEYDEPILTTLSGVRPQGSVYVIDLGANSGFFALRLFDLAHRHGFCGCIHLVAIEGSPKNAKRLVTNLRECGSPPGCSVRMVHGLVGSRSGFGHIRELHCNATSHVAADGVAVPYIDLNPMLQDWPRIDLVKCDIEGSEYEFVKTYPELMARTEAAVFELHNTGGDRSRHCRELLRSYGLLNPKVLRTFGANAINTVEFFRRDQVAPLGELK